jgi:hypothetical protein
MHGGRPQVPIEIGTRFGRLVVTAHAEPKDRRSRSVCRCDCGKEVVRANHLLRSGNVKSCGCLLRDMHTIHGGSRRMERERLWRILQGMKQRCRNPKSRIYKHYGGRGITVCKEWAENYSAFREWAMNNGYETGKSIDRIDVNGNYEPSNCRWVTQKEQCLNKRNNRYIEINGESKLLGEWCKVYGTPEKLARGRLHGGKTGIQIFIPQHRIKGGKQ